MHLIFGRQGFNQWFTQIKFKSAITALWIFFYRDYPRLKCRKSSENGEILLFKASKAGVRLTCKIDMLISRINKSYCANILKNWSWIASIAESSTNTMKLS